MTRSQTGVFVHGTYGFPVNITLSSTPDPAIDLTTVTSMALTLDRPAESGLDSLSIALGVPSAIVNAAAGIIQWVPASGDLPVAGMYHFTITLVFPAPAQLTIAGTMKVT